MTMTKSMRDIAIIMTTITMRMTKNMSIIAVIIMTMTKSMRDIAIIMITIRMMKSTSIIAAIITMMMKSMRDIITIIITDMMQTRYLYHLVGPMFRQSQKLSLMKCCLSFQATRMSRYSALRV